MAEITPRYEFRIWAENLTSLRDKLQQRGTPSRSETSKETYLISAATDRCNAKIRNDLMDIKILVGTRQGLEQWKPVLKAGFPIDRSVIEQQVFPNLAVSAPHLSRDRYAIDEFLGEVIKPQPAIAVVAVSKQRQQFSLDDCQAEFASTTIDNVARDTVAMESADAEAVVRLMREFGIDGVANTNYIREIKRILGK